MVEESAAADELGEGGQGGDDASTLPANEPDVNARLVALLRSNADRMARRIAGGSAPSAAVLADAMSITEAQAVSWLASRPAESDHLAESLVQLAVKGQLQ